MMPLPARTFTAINEVFPAIQTSNDLPLEPCRALLSSSGISLNHSFVRARVFKINLKVILFSPIFLTKT